MSYIFHVHTSRCRHASDDPDEAYIKKAIELESDSITFTDHAPFPGDPFTGRMKYCQLKEYISSLKQLKERYAGTINIFIGLEIEYLPSFRAYYEDLKANDDIDLLMIGQHHYEISSGIYNFKHHSKEWFYLCEAMLEGVDSNLFDILAHPDRAFATSTYWSTGYNQISAELIKNAVNKNIFIEKNYSSMRKENLYKPDFWKSVPQNAKIIYGCDAHNNDMIKTDVNIAQYSKSFIKDFFF